MGQLAIREAMPDDAEGIVTYLHHGFYVVGTARRHAKVRGRYLDETLIEKFLLL